VAVFAQPNTQIKVVRSQDFNGSFRKVAKFIIVYKLYVQIRMRGIPVEDQI